MKNANAEIQLTWKFVFNLLFVLMILSTMLVFINRQTKQVAMKNEMIAKELCVLLTRARKNTTIIINEDVIVEKSNNDLIVKKNQDDVGYSYPCYAKGFQIRNEKGKVIIEIK